MSTRTALITGGAGFIGSHLSQALLARGYRVRILDNLVPQVHGVEQQFPNHIDHRVECLLGNVCNEDIVSTALQDINVVFHLAALTGVGQSMYQVKEYATTNVAGTSTLLQCLIERKRGLERLVLASSRAVYGEGKYECAACGIVYPTSRPVSQLDAKQWELKCPRCGGAIHSLPTDERSVCQPASVYAITKMAQEELALCLGQAYELPVVVLRYFNVYGAGQAPSNPYTGLIMTFLARLMSGQPLELYEDGQMQRDFVHIRDVVNATVAAAEHPDAINQRINVGTGIKITVEQIAKTLIEITGSSRPAQQAKVARVGDIRHAVADIQRARELLGYTPNVTLREGLAELVDWFKRQDGQTDRTTEARSELEQYQLLR